ncbi:hypothetical protein GP486_000233 [Trichoglossum hirsutum]|uniref:Uncharacterized protein n=1 Tax=Trichoglossum hirsutum TaxID=265104 RepID=A0A9P8LJ68_9PEZI|nr:hypothetical protein GP486_000233 [Trichoglossum hirsutum]
MAATVPEAAQFSSPKRKRHPTETPTLPTRLNTNVALPPASFAEEARQGGGSPRTAVAKDLEQLRLRGKGRGRIDFQQAIRNGGEIGEPGDVGDTLEVEGNARKRAKMRSAAVENEGDSIAVTIRLKSNKALPWHDNTDNSSTSPNNGSGSNDIQKRPEGAIFEDSSPTSSARLKTKTRLTTPPPSSSNVGEEHPESLDVGGVRDGENFRSSLTWRDDEITGMDLNDPDDDGEGVNGIGYKPTPAQAYARTEKRKQQVMDYRSREANEARKRRIERRSRLATPVAEDGEPQSRTARKVRFADGADN